MHTATAILIYRKSRQINDLSKLPEHKNSDTPAFKIGARDRNRTGTPWGGGVSHLDAPKCPKPNVVHCQLAHYRTAQERTRRKLKHSLALRQQQADMRPSSAES